MEDERLLYNISVSYYINKLSQDEIARQYNLSRTKVFNLITEASKRGIVEVAVDYPESWHTEAEEKLKQLFPLREIHVINSKYLSINDSYDATCEAVANYIEYNISNKTVISVSRGKTLNRVISHMRPVQAYPGMLVLQLCGLMNEKEPRFEELNFVRRIADMYGCHTLCFALPFLLSSPELKEQLLSSTIIKDVISRSRGMDIICSSVSTLEPMERFLHGRDLHEISNLNIVGCYEGQFLDIQGNIVDTPLYKRTMAPSISVLHGAKKRICVACGRYKAAPVLAMLRSDLANVFFMDSKLAIQVLNLIEAEGLEL